MYTWKILRKEKKKKKNNTQKWLRPQAQVPASVKDKKKSTEGKSVMWR